MNKITFAILTVLLSLFFPLGMSAQREAFPGAEGYGRMTTGGRGGAVYHVTTLEDNNQKGSFRYAVNQKGPRTIVFDVSGTIYLTSELRVREGNLTIAGQTAPGDGICIADYPFTISASNVIVRFMRFRLGNRQVAYHEGDGLGGMDASNIIIDHCSVSWSIDECLSVYGSKNTTVQWCIVSHSLQNSGHSKGAHGYGGNWGGSGASYHHNLIANHSSRTPRLGPRPGTQSDERMDMRNNVIYNYGSNGCYGGEAMNVNIVNNYYKPGKTKNNHKSRIAGIGIRTIDYCLDKGKTATNYNKVAGTSYTDKNVSVKISNGVYLLSIGGNNYQIDLEAGTINVDGTQVDVAWNGWRPTLHQWGTFYVKGNVNPSDAAVTADNWTTGIYSQISSSGNDGLWNDQTKEDIKLDTPIDYVYTTTHSANDAFEKVLAYAGASLSRDEYDAVVVKDAKEGTASFTSTGIIDSQDQVVLPSGAKGWPVLVSTDAPVDTDGDGIPDSWEKENGLDPNDASDGNAYVSGYTNLERYMNSLVADIMENGNKGGKLLTANLEDTDAAVELPPYEEPVVTDYVLSSETYLKSDPTTTWNFAGGISITNANGKGKSDGKNGHIKYSSGTQFTIQIPEGMAVSGVTFSGYNNYANKESYLSEVNGVEHTECVFPAKNPDNVIKTYTIDLASSVSDKLTFTVGGDQCCFIITLHVGNASSGIDDIITDADNVDAEGDGRIYNLMDVEVKEPLAPGIYIRNGKKILVK